MDFKEIIKRAQEIQKNYRILNKKQGYATWGVSEYLQGFVGDVGDLMKLAMAKENFRHAIDIDQKLARELADCLWSVIIISKEFGVDLEKEFLLNMDEFEKKFSKKRK